VADGHPAGQVSEGLFEGARRLDAAPYSAFACGACPMGMATLCLVDLLAPLLPPRAGPHCARSGETSPAMLGTILERRQ